METIDRAIGPKIPDYSRRSAIYRSLAPRGDPEGVPREVDINTQHPKRGAKYAKPPLMGWCGRGAIGRAATHKIPDSIFHSVFLTFRGAPWGRRETISGCRASEAKPREIAVDGSGP